jgi:2-polyprenyl-3-methyl-5-hydroxy-6-metoxy-1,4-benzoquinol methylase
MKLLIIIRKAHDLPRFDTAVEKVLANFDKLIFYWYPIHETNVLMRKAFLEEYTEYTHLAILCDDLIVSEESINKLINHIEKNDYGFICGVANYSVDKSDFLNVSMQSPGRKRNYTLLCVRVGSEEYIKILSQPQPVKVRHMGEPFPIIRRDIAEKFSFDLDDKIMGLPPEMGMNNDVVMSNEAYDLGIDIMCDFTAFFYHMKISDTNGEALPLGVGKREPYTKFVPAVPEFDFQWQCIPSPDIEYNDNRIAEFTGFTNIKSLEGKYCLDAGCGNGRYTYAMQKLGASKVDSFDVSTEAIAKCKDINSNAFVNDIMNLKPNPIYDFVLSWGVLHHLEDTRKAFSKIVSQVKDGGILHIMVYNIETQGMYEEDRKRWPILSIMERMNLCQKKVVYFGGTIHGWFDTLNPKYNWGFTVDEVKKWFEEEGFTGIKVITTHNINVQGQFYATG